MSRQTALQKAFAEHAEKIEKRGCCNVRKYDDYGNEYWIVSYNRGDIKRAIKNCINNS